MDRLAYSYEDAAAAVGVTVKTIQRLVAKGDLIPRYPNRRPIIPASELQAWLDRLPSEPPGR
jgi:hypothetical protein